ncbi:putative RNA-directed DNA polymerase from transposon BS [Trichonephila clavipes]|nr:putative RNA-directed DNA polymerase from transposon BS [Trichonephila clavipes]
MDKDTENYARKLVHGCRSSEHGIPIFKEFFTMQELNMALSNLDPSKSPGPNNIHGQMISRLSDWGKKSLLEIFNLSWRLGRLPRDWKKALIIPIRKSSKKASYPESFRPIALTNFSCVRWGLFADDIVLWNSTLSDIQIFAEQHKLIFNASKSTSSFFTTNRRLYNYQPQIFMESKSLPYEKHPKYLGYILDPEILSNKHIDYVINKGRKRLDLLKYIAGRDWGADAGTLRLTYTSLIRPVLEYGSQIYFSASRTNLAKLDRVQSSAARIITGMRHSCPTDLVLFEADIIPLDLRRKLLLSKYFCKLYSYGDYNRTSAYLITWTNRHRLKRDSPFSRMQAMDLLDQDIEEHFLKNVFNNQEGLPRVHFKPEMGAHTSKNQDPPEYLRQLALEIINKIPATAMQIYTDGIKDEQNSCGSGIFIKAPNCSHNIKIRNSDFCSVFRSELIAIDEALRIIKTMTSPDEIWILCDSRSAIQHLSDWTNVGDKTSLLHHLNS